MNECIERETAIKRVMETKWESGSDGAAAMEIVAATPAADVAPVVRCKDCAYSTLPSELTQRYGKQGTLTCHNMHAPSNRRNVGSNDFCSYGERKDGGADNA